MQSLVVNLGIEAGRAASKSNGAQTRLDSRLAVRTRLRLLNRFFVAFLFLVAPLFAQERTMHITQRYLNIPIGHKTTMRVFQISVDGNVKREFPAQLAEGSTDYWIFLDMGEFQGQRISITGSASQPSLDRIYQSTEINKAASLYKEPNRPQFHFTVKRGWNNDVNGPIYYKGRYHLFWQAFPFGVTWDTGFMYWGHAVSEDLIHWKELSPALMVDKLGAAWSGSSLVDRNNDGGWGKDALVLVYTAFDRISHKQVQCIAYSTDNGGTFTRFSGNPVLDSSSGVGSNDTRDPKVFWYEATRHWVMVLFEKDGMSFYTSTDLKSWTRQSHFKGLFECPDFFEMPVDGDSSHRKWILHGGSSSYFIGSFDGTTFIPETSELRYAEGKNANGDDVLYAAQSFADMPNGRRVQMAWGRITQQGMPFNQMMLFPTEFKLKTTKDGLRLEATPVREIERLHQKAYAWSSLTAVDANHKLSRIAPGPLHVKVKVTLEKEDELVISYKQNVLTSIKFEDLENGRGSVEMLIDKSVAELFLDGGMRYVVREISVTPNAHGLEFQMRRPESMLNAIEIYRLSSIWSTPR